MDDAVAAIVRDYTAGRIKRPAATWRLMFHAEYWRDIDRWLESVSVRSGVERHVDQDSEVPAS
jgi:hypothetical protein